MKFYFKKIASLLLAGIIIFSLASCENNQKKEKDNISKPPSDSIEDNLSSGGENKEPTDNKENESLNEKLIVRFISDDGIPISIKECKKGDTVIPPAPPRKIGCAFSGWNGNYTNITQNTDIVAIYTDISNFENAIVADTVFASTTTEFEVLIGIYGNVNFCGLDMDIRYDSSLIEYLGTVDVDDSVILNDMDKNAIHMNYVTTNNTTGDVVFMILKFKANNTTKTETGLQISVNSMYTLDSEEDLIKSKYQIIQNKIIIEEAHNEQ